MGAPAVAERNARDFGARGRVLHRYLENLRRAGSNLSGGGRNGPERELLADPWVREQVQRFVAAEGTREDPMSTLVAHAVALLDKCSADLEVLELRSHETTTRVWGSQAELMLDTAVGMALVRETQRTIDAALKAGRNDEARHLSRFLHTVRHAVYAVRHHIEDGERKRASRLAERLIEPQVEQQARQADGPPDDPGRDGRRASVAVTKLPTAEPIAVVFESTPALPRAARTMALALVLMISCLLLWAVGGVPGDGRSERAGVVLSSLEPAHGLRAALDRYPSLFLVVDGSAWDAMEEEGRDRLVHDVYREISAQGYTGMFVRDENGRPLARWTRPTAPQLLARRAGDREPTP